MSIKVERFINSRFSSNTFVLSYEGANDVWVIDPGDIRPVSEWMVKNSKVVIKGVLLTHSHFDHVYGLNYLLFLYRSCPIYVANEYGRTALFDAKKNGSRFTEAPFVLKEGAEVRIMDSSLELWVGINVEIIYTIGHTPDSACFVLGNLIFTGDTLIKGKRTVTKLHGGSVPDLKRTIAMIKSRFQGKGLIVMGGHEDSFELDVYDLSIATFNPLSDS